MPLPNPTLLKTNFRDTIDYPNKIDLIVSSVRPFRQDEKYAALQKAAILSWGPVAKRIVLFNQPEDLDGWVAPGTICVMPDQNPPQIKQLIAFTADLEPQVTVAIVNADIVLGPEAAKIPQAAYDHKLAVSWGCCSLRYTFDFDNVLGTKASTHPLLMYPKDYGLDFFCAPARIWQECLKEVPGVLTLGRSPWDNWINGWFRGRVDASRYFDITEWRAVFHPKHAREGREEPLPPLPAEEIAAALSHAPHPGGVPRLKFNLPT
jgi:hypothetical protein